MTKQVHINLSKEAYDELNELKIKLKLNTVSEVIRSSITLQKFLESEKERGSDIILRNKKDKTDKQLVMLK
jgi:hypothetical protein